MFPVLESLEQPPSDTRPEALPAQVTNESTIALLDELEALSEAEVQRLLAAENPAGNIPDAATNIPRNSAFDCPDAKSEWFGRRHCNLIIVINKDFEAESFERVVDHVREFDPLIHAVVRRDQTSTGRHLPVHPTLTFSPAILRHPDPSLGRIFCGYPMSKSEEYSILEKAGIGVPKWILLKEGPTPDLGCFGEYVVRKPDYGGKGAEVAVMRKGRVRWKPITTYAAGMSTEMIVQEFIRTGRQPVSYRVNTLFGKALYSLRHQGTRLAEPTDGGASVVASARGAQASFNYDEEIIRLAETAAAAFPDIPLLGFDIIREFPSGKLYVLEANAIGYVWNFHRQHRADYGFSLETQFNGVRKAAYILAEATQQHAA